MLELLAPLDVTPASASPAIPVEIVMNRRESSALVFISNASSIGAGAAGCIARWTAAVHAGNGNRGSCYAHG